MATVFDVAAAILTRKGAVSHMKLHKLIYYAQAWSLVWEEAPLFPEPIEAWANGPVVPVLYEHLRGKFTIELADLAGKGDPNALTPVQQETVEKVLEFYGPKNPQWLSDLTHMEAPWQQARVGVPAGERSQKEISLASLAEYYGGL